jgi:hypothetical protein
VIKPVFPPAFPKKDNTAVLVDVDGNASILNHILSLKTIFPPAITIGAEI